MTATAKFKLSETFIEKYKNKKPPFGFNGLGEIVFMRTYSRVKEDGKNEKWYETVERVVNGTYNMQKEVVEKHALGWNPHKAQKSAQEMYDRIFNIKFLPPGRGLWAMGTAITEDKKLYAALNNCALVSTKDMKDDPSKPFCFLMDMSMLGVGVGFDVYGAGTITIKGPAKGRKEELFEIPDSREGWVDSLRLVIDSYFHGTHPIAFDYSKIRGVGLPIKTFGGITSGPAPLKELHESIRAILEKEIGNEISIRSIMDIMNMICKAVVSGNVRRSASIALYDEGEEFLDLKNYEKNPDRKAFGWASNNSIFAKIGMDYTKVVERIKANGEPGLIWLDNIRKFSRMCDLPDNKDRRAVGSNPCVEQSLESYECCNLVETFPARHENLEDYIRTLKFAYLYAKTVTLGPTHWPETNRIMMRNRRIGCSMSGVAQFLAKKGLNELKVWAEKGYKAIEEWDIIYSEWLAVPMSIKMTSVKPSGTVALLAGATPGMHFPESRFYIRRVRLSKISEMVEPLKKAGYNIEPCVDDKENTVVVEIPVDVGEGVKTLNDVSIWEQLSLAAFMQRYWSDNQVSCTITFNPEKEGDYIKHALEYFQYQLKGISFLPRKKGGAYKQMPYEEITEEMYNKLMKDIKKPNLGTIHNEKADLESGCDTEKCTIDWSKIKKGE
jgi:adenosylcobalamin-dependent ribonucleoside-triphosphate reductase